MRGTVNLFQETDAPGAASSAGSADWRESAICDALVIRRKCPEHSKGQCQFNYDEAKAAALRADTAERARIEARLERQEQVRRDRQARADPTSAHRVAEAAAVAAAEDRVAPAPGNWARRASGRGSGPTAGSRPARLWRSMGDSVQCGRAPRGATRRSSATDG